MLTFLGSPQQNRQFSYIPPQSFAPRPSSAAWPLIGGPGDLLAIVIAHNGSRAVE
jgi:hypothetical protein